MLLIERAECSRYRTRMGNRKDASQRSDPENAQSAGAQGPRGRAVNHPAQWRLTVLEATGTHMTEKITKGRGLHRPAKPLAGAAILGD